jgi:large subunit ribosomal protein L24
MNRIKKGDEVVVLTGKDKGRRGNVIRVMDDNRVLVENINMAKRHTKANPQMGIAGGIIEKEMPLHASNVGLYNPATGKADRIGFKVLDDGRKVRYFKSNNEVVDA